MNPTRFIAAIFAACTTFAVLSAVLSIAEPQRSTLIAKQSAPTASQPVGVAAVQGEPRLPAPPVIRSERVASIDRPEQPQH